MRTMPGCSKTLDALYGVSTNLRLDRALIGRGAQFFSVPSKSMVACVPSQNGLFPEWPHRQSAI